jgi:hypothetical protein
MADPLRAGIGPFTPRAFARTSDGRWHIAGGTWAAESLAYLFCTSKWVPVTEAHWDDAGWKVVAQAQTTDKDPELCAACVAELRRFQNGVSDE